MVQAAAGAAKRQYPKKTAPPPRIPKVQRETKASQSQAPEPPQPPKPTPTPPSPTPRPPQAPIEQGPQYHSKEQASSTKSTAIDLDGRDPDFAASLRSIGPVDPTQGHPTAANRGAMQSVFPSGPTTAMLVHTARQRASKIAEDEAERMRMGHHGDRQFADAFLLQQALQMRDVQNLPNDEIESIFGLKAGFMDQLGDNGVVSSFTR
ncbi:hypothetical protein VI817_009756 [Penicillium citrinum]|nr:hypothetical protein VI817_009756 [Penicillium citrinum]